MVGTKETNNACRVVREWMALEERFPLSKNEKVSDLFCDIYLAKSIFFQFYLLSFIY